MGVFHSTLSLLILCFRFEGGLGGLCPDRQERAPGPGCHCAATASSWMDAQPHGWIISGWACMDPYFDRRVKHRRTFFGFFNFKALDCNYIISQVSQFLNKFSHPLILRLKFHLDRHYPAGGTLSRPNLIERLKAYAKPLTACRDCVYNSRHLGFLYKAAVSFGLAHEPYAGLCLF